MIIEIDKLYHLIAGLVITLLVGVIYILVDDKWLALLPAFFSGVSLGILKEVYDLVSQRGTFEFEDIWWTLAGSLVGILVLVVILIIFVGI